MTDKSTEPASYKAASENDLKKLKIDVGFVGQLIGSKPSAPSNIAAIFILLLLIPGIVDLFCKSQLEPERYWAIISPLLTLALGYIFGKNSGS